MRDIILQCAGVAAVAVALIHGVLGETKVFARATIQPESLRTLIRLVWQAGTVAWIGGAVLLIASRSTVLPPLPMRGGHVAVPLVGRRSAW
jgi:hypothetical protein